MSKTYSTSSGISFAGLLTVAFIVLKLAYFIDWKWVWVLSPIWISISISILILMILAIIVIFKK